MFKKVFFSTISWAIFLVLFFTHFVVALVVMWFFPRPYLAHMKLTRFFIRLLYVLHGVKLKVTGLEHLPNSGAFILMANHLSLLDILTILAAVPADFAFVGKEELSKVPLLGWDMRLQKHFFIRRAGGKAVHEQMRQMKHALATGRSLFVFPEGTRSKTGELGPFKNGFFRVAVESRVPVVPIGIQGTNKILPKSSLSIHRGHIRVSVGVPVYPETNDDQAVVALQTTVRDHISNLISES